MIGASQADADEGMAADLGPLPEAAVDVLARALERAAGKAFKSANRRGQEKRADRMWDLTMSGLGGCPRQAAYRLAGVPPTDPALAYDQEARQAMIGTWIHAGLLPEFEGALAQADIEVPMDLTVRVVAPPELGVGPYKVIVVKGTADMYTPVMGGGVLDLKTVYAHHLGDLDHDGAAVEEHRWQVRGYATAARQLGLPVAWVAWLYLDRSSGEVLVMVEPFDQDAEEDTIAHVRALWALAANPDYAPRGNRGPGITPDCNGCAWLKQCWGPDAEPDDTTAMQSFDRPEIESAAARYKELGDQIAELQKEQKVCGAVVGRPELGRYGDVTITYQRDGEELDRKATVEQVVLLGGEPVMRPRKGNRLINWATGRNA